MRVTSSELGEVYSHKTDDELLSLHAGGSLMDFAYEVLEAELKARGVSIPARPLTESAVEAETEKFRRTTLAAHWRGEAPLASAYWLLGNLGVGVLTGLLLLIFHFLPSLALVTSASYVVFLIFTWVSIWRCWRNSSWIGWGYIARAMVILSVFVFAAQIFGAFNAISAEQ